MIKIAICDKEKEERDYICALTQNYLSENMIDGEVDCFGGGRELSAHFTDDYQLILLDIYMDGLDGLKATKRISKTNQKCEVIFITTSKEHELNGFLVKAIDYLLKPVSKNALENALRLSLNRFSEVNQYLVIREDGKKRRFFVPFILWATSSEHGTVLHTRDGDIHADIRLDELEKKVDSISFCRISTDYLVHFKEVSHLDEEGFHMMDSSVVPLPKEHRRQKLAGQMYKDYLFHHANKGGFL